MTRSTEFSATMVSAAAVGVLGLLIFLGAFTIDTSRADEIAPEVIMHFLFNTIIVLTALFFAVRAHPYSIHLFHLIGLLIFVCVAGLYQYLSGMFPIAGSTAIFRDEIPVANLAVTLWIIPYLLGYGIRGNLSRRMRSGALIRALEQPISVAGVHFALVVGLVALMYLASLGLVGAFTRAAANNALEAVASGPVFFINGIFVRAIPLLAVAATALTLRKGRSTLGIRLLIPVFVFEVVGVAITNSPFAAARYWFVAVVVGLSAPHLLARRRTGVLLLVLSIAGLSILPSLGSARNAETLAETFQLYLRLDSPFDYLAMSGDVDAFGMMALTLEWMEKFGLRWGMQMAGAALFWVPRALWPSKPVGTGAMVTGDLGFDFTNFSVPIMTEPLIDFGLVGVPIFALAFGWILSSIDRAYWVFVDSDRILTGCRRIDVIYPFWMGLMLFMTRGDLLSSFGYTVGVTLAMLPLVLVPGRLLKKTGESGAGLESFPPYLDAKGTGR